MEEVEKQIPERDEKGRLLPGNTANPFGRPKDTFSIVGMIKSKLQEAPEGESKTYAELFIDQLMQKTIHEADTAMMRDMINRVDGMPKQAVDHTTAGEKIMYLPMEIIEKNNLNES